MKKIIITQLLLFLVIAAGITQELTQTIRGTVLDVDSNMPLIGAEVIVIGSNPLLGTTTDVDGSFRFENVSIGRISLMITYLGFEDYVASNIVVNSAKEIVLDLYMQESTIKIDEIVIKVDKQKGEALNDMAIISSRSISAEKSERYAGGFSDPSRIVSAYAGVAATNDGDNDIIIRGNSPKYMQWKLEGMEITNPTHFADQNAVKGGISALNNNLLATSDFHTGAFAPEFGNALSGVYDVRLRAGNNEQYESTFGFGLLGTDLTFEGPFKKGKPGSFLINYRYSTISLIEKLGLVDVGGIPKFQDAAFKINLPTKKAGIFSIFGLGGISNFNVEDVKASVLITPGDNPNADNISEDYDKSSFLGNIGINHTINIGENSYLKSTLGYSTDGVEDDVFESTRTSIFDEEGEFLRDTFTEKSLDYRSRLIKSNQVGSLTYHHKFNAKNKIQVGTKCIVTDYNYNQSWFDDKIGARYTASDFDESIMTVRNFISWKHRLNEKLTLVAGIHNTNVFLNDKNTFEPRFAFAYRMNKQTTLNFGYGKHSTMESIHNYYAEVQQPDGTTIQTNKDLDLLKADHLVIGCEERFNKNLSLKIEAYYQRLYNIPVENSTSSSYSTLNEGVDFRFVDLVNEGTGKNYGVEVTLERFLSNNYYFILNGSLFSSKYTALDGIERNTQYNGNYIANLLIGKEFINIGKKKNKSLSINAKVFFGGGKKIIPLLRDENGELAVDPTTDSYWDYDKSYEDKIEDVYTIILSASYKINKKGKTHEIFLTLDNLTNTQGRLSEFYDPTEPSSIGYSQQFGFFPNLMYKFHF